MIKFVENKSVDMLALSLVMQDSIRQNHHTNFGPTSRKLGVELAVLNGLDPTFNVLMGSSATAVLTGLVSALNNHHMQTLRWVCSDFGFLNSYSGPFAGAQHIGCNAVGMMDLDKLKRLKPTSYDAILLTNIFGQVEDFDAYFDFASTHNKVLIVDNAAGFLKLRPYHQQAKRRWPKLQWAEVVSFHHTKPWGMGEGGAVFAPRAWIPLVQSSLNFGICEDGSTLQDRTWCGNGKISEIACAQILIRLRARDTWLPLYQQQCRRIHGLGVAAGLKPLLRASTIGAPGQIAFLMDNPIDDDQLDNPDVKLMKYYRPIEGICSPQSINLYERMVNVPCHAELSRLSDDQLFRLFENLRLTDLGTTQLYATHAYTNTPHHRRLP